MHVRVITATCKPFNQQETKEICQAREALALTQFIDKIHNKWCCKQGDGYTQQGRECANEVKQEDCDSECRKKCLVYTQEKDDLEGSRELVEPLKEVEHHSGSSRNLGKEGTSYAFSGRVGSTIFVSFKGSGVALGDWTANGDLVAKKITAVNWNLAGQQPHLYAHGGFLEYYNSVKGSVFLHVAKMISDRPASEIHVSGHSLGGAMANLCALDFAAKYPDVKVALWTFGAPRVFRGLPENDSFAPGENSAKNGVCAWMHE